MTEEQISQINSAEMTAYWRTSEPLISNDNLSVKLASEAGIGNAKEVENKFNYHCVSRLISVRARYFFDQAARLLKTGKYDGCISFASGFSLLNDNLYNAIVPSNIKFYDSDLAHVVKVRNDRMNKLVNQSGVTGINHSKTVVFDLNDVLLGNSLQNTFVDIKNPLIILEGISYFISNEILDRLFEQLTVFNHAAILLDYFPSDSAKRSEHFRKHAKNITSFIPQIINTIQADKSSYLNSINIDNHVSVQDYEKHLCQLTKLDRILTDENKFFPTQFIILTLSSDNSSST